MLRNVCLNMTEQKYVCLSQTWQVCELYWSVNAKLFHIFLLSSPAIYKSPTIITLLAYFMPCDGWCKSVMKSCVTLTEAKQWRQGLRVCAAFSGRTLHNKICEAGLLLPACLLAVWNNLYVTPLLETRVAERSTGCWPAVCSSTVSPWCQEGFNESVTLCSCQTAAASSCADRSKVRSARI